MSEKLRESLSAAMDDEADAFELRRVLDEASQDPELRELWHRQHLIRDVLQGQLKSHPSELRSRVQAAMDAGFDDVENDADETESPSLSVVDTPAAPGARNWLGRLGGTAVAASVAALVVWSAGIFNPEPTLPINEGNSFAGAEINTSQLHRTATAADRLRMDAHRMQHYQWNAINRPGGVSFVRVMTFKSMPDMKTDADPVAPAVATERAADNAVPKQ